MKTQTETTRNIGDTAQVAVTRRKGLSLVWLLPLVAAVVGGWLIYQAMIEKGPTVTIHFKNAEGLEAEKTKIKYKSVEVGKVMAITISEDLKEVIVTAELDRDVKPYLREKTRFWVVRPRIGMEGISGLGTLLSGAFIEIEPGDGAAQSKFKGLEIPPVVRAENKGRRYILESDQLGSLHAGAPIYFREIHVGEVLGYELEKSGKNVMIHIFVDEPYHNLVRQHTRFWNVSGVDVSVGAEGVNVRTGSLQSLLAGGIAFDTPSGEATKVSAEDTRFRLHKRFGDAFATTYSEKLTYVLYFNGSVRGLKPGAPVELRGIHVGKVTAVDIEIDNATLEVRLPVTIEIEPERVAATGPETDQTAEEAIEVLVQQGLRAQLKTGSLLTGQLLVELDFHPETAIKLAGITGPHPELPTIPAALESIENSVSTLLTKLKNLPLAEIAQNIEDTTKGTSKLVNDAEIHKAVKNANTTLKAIQKLTLDLDKEFVPMTAQLQKTLAGLDENSPAYVNLVGSIQELKKAARSVRSLTDYLERNPNALIAGKNKPGG